MKSAFANVHKDMKLLVENSVTLWHHSRNSERIFMSEACHTYLFEIVSTLTFVGISAGIHTTTNFQFYTVIVRDFFCVHVLFFCYFSRPALFHY